MFKLLDLTPLTFSTTAASRNYRHILSIIHPDKNGAPNAERVTQAVVYAYSTLNDSAKRFHYMFQGTPTTSEPYDEEEGADLAKQMRELLAEYDRTKKKSPAILSREPKDVMISSNIPPEACFNDFLQKCKEAAVATDVPRNDSASSPYDEHPQQQPTEGSSRPDSGVGCSSPDSDTIIVHPVDGETRNPQTSSTPQPDVILIDSEDDDDDSNSEAFDPEIVFRNINPFNSHPTDTDISAPVNRSPSPFIDESDYEPSCTSRSRHGSSQVSHSPKTKKFANASTSPLARTYVDRGTSPFKPGDPVVFRTVGFTSSASESPSDGRSASRVRQNLNFDAKSSDSSSEQGSPKVKTRTSDSNRDYLSSSLNDNGTIIGDLGEQLFIVSILNMRTRPDGVKFRVIWGPGGYERTERLETVLKEKRGLRNWLYKLRFEEPRRFSAVLKFHPEFRSILGNSNAASSGSGTSRKNKTFG